MTNKSAHARLAEILAIVEEGETSCAEVMAKVGLGSSVTRHYLCRLRDQGKIHVSGSGWDEKRKTWAYRFSAGSGPDVPLQTCFGELRGPSARRKVQREPLHTALFGLSQPQKEAAATLIMRFLDPEDLGLAVSAEVRDLVRVIIGQKPVETRR